LRKRRRRRKRKKKAGVAEGLPITPQMRSNWNPTTRKETNSKNRKLNDFKQQRAKK
jgi:hypothetical protein